jgi:hypothetical protein
MNNVFYGTPKAVFLMGGRRGACWHGSGEGKDNRD